MTGRRLRESPRVVVATVLVGGLLVLIGILVASTTAGGTAHTSSPAARPAAGPVEAKATTPAAAQATASAQQAAALRTDQATIARLRASLHSQGDQLSSATARVRAAQADARCWHQKVIHPIKTRGLRCARPA